MQRRALNAALCAVVLGAICGGAAAQPAPSPTDAMSARYWPTVTAHGRALEVSDDGSSRPLRRFNAPRPAARPDNPTRRHVGVDLFASAGDGVIAVANGRIVAFYPFLRAATGEMTYALLVAHAGYVANYGEVRATSLIARGLRVDDAVDAGQEIAEVSDTRQLHFETYQPGVTRTRPWAHGAARPEHVLDPTPLLRDLAESGQRRMPGQSTAARP